MSSSVERLARRLTKLERDVRNAATQPRLANSAIDGGALSIVDVVTGYPTGIFGQQYDGTTSAAAVGGTFPVAPSQPFVTEIVGGLRIYWDGTYVDGSPTRMDFRRVTLHAVTDVDDIDPLDPAQIVGEITIATGGEVTVGLPYVEHFIYAVTWTEAGKFSVESDIAFGTPRFVSSGDLEPGTVGSTDGLAPTVAPDVTGTPGFKSVMLTWDPITNADPVWYEIAASDVDGFTPVVGDVVGNTTGTMANIVTAHSPVYIRVRAIDGDGAGPWSDQDAVTPIAGIDQAALDAAIDVVEADLVTVNDTLTTANSEIDDLQGDLAAASALITAAQNAADAAQLDADAAQLTADGKNKVTYSTATPGATPNTAGDVWFQRDAGTGRVIAMFEGTGGTSWSQRTLDGLVIAAIDAGTITTGTLSAARIAAGSLSIGQVNGLQSSIDSAQASAIASSSGGYANTNPLFKDWSGGPPDGYTSGGGTTLTKETSVVRTPPNAVRWNVTNPASNGNLTATTHLAGVPLGQYIVVDTEVFLTSGTFSGSGIRVTWTGTGGTNWAVLRFDDAGATPTTGLWYRFTKVLKRPATATGTQTSWTALISANAVDGSLGAGAAKNVVVDRVGFRSATTEEILAYESTAAIAGAQATAIATAASDANSQYGETKTLVAGWRVTGQTTINGGAIATDTITAVQIAANAITASELAALSVTAGKIAANAVTANEIAANAITTDKLAANAVTAAKIAALTITGNEIAANTITAAQIAADYVYTGVVTANQVISGNLSAVVALLGEISTASSGRRITISSADGFRALDDVGDTIVQIPTDSTQDVSIKADVVANSITATGPIAMRSDANEIAKAGRLILRGATAAPTTPAIVTPTWQTLVVESTYAARALGGNYYPTALKTYQAWSDGINSGVWVFDNTGAHVTGDEWTVSTSSALTVVNVARAGGTIYLLLKDTTAGKWWIRRVGAATHTIIGTDFEYGTIATYDSVGMCILSTGNTLTTVARTSTQYLRRHYNITGEAAPVLLGSAALQTGGVDSTILAGPVVDIVETAAEGDMPSFNSSTSRLFLYRAGQGQVAAYQARGTGTGTIAQETASSQEFPVAFGDSNISMLTYNDGLATLLTFTRATGAWNYYDGTRWSSESSNWKITTTWRDSDATGGTHETTQGPVANLFMKKRARLLVTAPPIPDAGGTDDANAVSIYVGRGDGTRTTQWRQATPADGVRSAVVQTVTFSGTNPPAANDFPAATPAAIVDGSTAVTLLDSNGDATLRNVNVTGYLTQNAAVYDHATKTATENVNAGATNVLSGTSITIDHPGGSADSAYVITASLDVENTGGNGTLSVVLETSGGVPFLGQLVFKGASGDRATIFQQWGWYPGSIPSSVTVRLKATNSSGAGAYQIRQDHTKVFAQRVA